MSNTLDVPFETTLLVRDTCLCLHVQRAARALARQFDEALRPVGLTNGQFSLMMSLNRPSPPPMKPVAELLAMDQTTLTAALKPLQRQGWVEIIVNPNDRRERLLQLTLAGKATLAAAVPIWKTTHAEVERKLFSADQLRQDLLALSSV
ncbi:DNA-binding MarR family transcriptional regulator [Ochrobactrum daejeonense]|uniref:DNA-binding MarR family transcriptional regulator n=1 Tax=Brucella daejeonensis TaxID=659015 RepID=A0A7W9AY99_9HYPH|nr:MarR family winged helix-turn-helix transcriptional regulator [Brucella daejeonensis]MBB5702783.1 DNA-binding MarR family transcriptional regulator [Brucella daejeonensis]